MRGDPPSAPAAGPGLRVQATLCLVQTAFGGFHVVAKAVLFALPPLALAGLRVAAATPFLVWLAWRKDHFVPARRDLPWLALLGFLGVTANQLFFITGLRLTTAINASILQPSLPVFAVAAAAVLGIERIGPRRLVGIGLSVAGALAVVNPLRLSANGPAVLGNCLILLNCLCYALFLVLQRPLLERIPWRTLIAWSFVFGGGAVVLVSLPTLARLDWPAVPAGAWWGWPTSSPSQPCSPTPPTPGPCAAPPLPWWLPSAPSSHSWRRPWRPPSWGNGSVGSRGSGSR